MSSLWRILLAWLLAAAVATAESPSEPLTAGDHVLTVTVNGQERSYLVHIPPRYEAESPTPVVLILHGARMNARMMVEFSGMHRTSDEAGFVAVYPNGSGPGSLLLSFNAGGLRGPAAAGRADDVKYVGALLDDLAQRVNVDAKRVYAAGMSNGGMMCYRLAAELSHRIAAIASVAGTMAIEECQPKRPVPVLHIHGDQDSWIPFDGPNAKLVQGTRFKSVDETMAAWIKLNGCPEKPVEESLPDRHDDQTRVRRKVYGPGIDGAEVVLYIVEGGGHTWPGKKSPLALIGRSTLDISANEVIWEFFKKHAIK